MSHRPPSLGGDYYDHNSQPNGINGQANGDAGQGLISDKQAAAAVATLAAHQKQQQQRHQQQQANDEALMTFFNEQSPAYFDSYDNMSSTTGLGSQIPGGDMFTSAPNTQQGASTAMVPAYGASNSTPHGVINGLQQMSSAQTDDDSPSRDPTEGVNTNVVMGGMKEPGAGPEPSNTSLSLATVGNAGASGALAEFTRRKNWPAKVVEELSDLLLIIEPNGRVRFASPNITKILGYTPEEVAGQSLTDMAHSDDRAVLLSDLNGCIASGSVMRLYVRLQKQDGSYAVVEMVGHAHIAASRFAPSPSNQSPFCQAVFLMARPYPTKNAHLLDSFLEHKMENERLRRRIEDLRREEEFEDRDDDSNAQSWVWRQSADTRSDSNNNNNKFSAAIASALGNSGPPASADLAAVAAALSHPGKANHNTGGVFGSLAAPTSSSMPPPMTPPKLGNVGGAGGTGGVEKNVALTRENLEGIAARRADSLCDKMARYERMPGAGGPASSTAATSGGITPTPESVRSGMLGGNNLGSNGPAGAPSTSASTVVGGPNSAAVGLGPSPINAATADTIEMITGMRYDSNRSLRLVKGDAGIAFSVTRDQRTGGEKKKKARLAEEYVCTDCGTLESPEWRKGPSGPKTLCNACGLRWAKKEKREKKKAAASVAGGGISTVVGGLAGLGLPGTVDSAGPGGESSPLQLDEE
ncbi:white collar 2 type of transcription factor [Sporothrix epigloea]|uniref:White collar 2 type of transcription factor n=1 Tax=Sporothrix epigloea TaxID=1892477 RepID=A0ABP0DEZ2_9PEZI